MQFARAAAISSINSIGADHEALHLVADVDRDVALGDHRLASGGSPALELYTGRHVTELTSHLNEKHCQLLGFDRQKAELAHLKQLVLGLELEKSRISCLLLDSEECLKDARKECSSISALEAQLSEMHESSIAADVGLTFTKVQYEMRIEELERCNLTIVALTVEKEALMVSLQDKTDESSRLALELNSLQGSLLSLHDEVQTERNLRDKLESTITDLTSQLNEKHCQVLGFDQQKAELIHPKQLVSDLE